MRYSTFLLLLVCGVLSFSPSFSQQVQQSWVQRYFSLGGAIPIAIKTDGANIYVLGTLNQYSSTEEFVLIKYNSLGQLLWKMQGSKNGPGETRVIPSALALDRFGNLYVTGKSKIILGVSHTSSAIVTIKYNSAGQVQWATSYFRSDTFPSASEAIVVDASGNSYITGYTIAGEAFAYDYITIKYDAAGVEQWVRTYNGTRGLVDWAKFIALDPSGNVYITGESQGLRLKGKFKIFTFQDYVTIKYDADGNVLWTQIYNSPFNRGDIPNGLAVDNAGNVYVTGQSLNKLNNDYVTVKYNTDGVLQWVARFDGPSNLNDIPKGIVVDGAGSVFVTGYSDAGGGLFNYVTIKYNAAGTQQWLASYNGPGNGSDKANTIALDGLGDVYVTGESMGVRGDNDFATVKYGSATGSQIWLARYNGPVNGSDKAMALAIYTPPGPAFSPATVYVVGSSDNGHWADIATIKYLQPILTISSTKKMNQEFEVYNDANRNPGSKKFELVLHNENLIP